MATITVGINSHVDVAIADAYFSDRYGFEEWVVGIDKEAALISATQQCDLSSSNWYSYKVDPDQKLEFPRVGYDPTPDDIKKAVCEIAYLIVVEGEVITKGEDVLKSFKAGSFGFTNEPSFSSNPIFNDTISRLLSKYGSVRGAGSSTMIEMGRA